MNPLGWIRPIQCLMYIFMYSFLFLLMKHFSLRVSLHKPRAQRLFLRDGRRRQGLRWSWKLNNHVTLFTCLDTHIYKYLPRDDRESPTRWQSMVPVPRVILKHPLLIVDIGALHLLRNTIQHKSYWYLPTIRQDSASDQIMTRLDGEYNCAVMV